MAVPILLLLTVLRCEPPQDLIVGADRAAEYRRLLPNLEDKLPAGLVWYDDKAMPTFIQDANGVIYPSDSDQFTRNGNNQDPWRQPFGTHTAEPGSISKFNFGHFPAPVAVWTDAATGRRRWVYPLNSIVGEVLLLRDPEGKWRAFEVRVRRRERYGWEPAIYRPVRNLAHLVDLVGDFEGEVQEHEITDAENSLSIKGKTFKLPPMKRAITDALLSRQFVRSDGFLGDAHGPASDARYGIVPRGHIGGAFSIDTATCAQCHQDAGNKFNLRGDDGIFSFSPLDASGLRPDLLSAGLLKRYNRDEIPTSIYPHLKEQK